MIPYNKEDLVLYNQKQNNEGYMMSGEFVYGIEINHRNTLDIEIMEFLDRFTQDNFSYVCDLVKAYRKEEKVDIEDWLKENDKKNLFNLNGDVTICGVSFNIADNMPLNVKEYTFNHKSLKTFNNLLNEAFHNVLKDLGQKEEEYVHNIKIEGKIKNDKNYYNHNIYL